MPSIAATGSPEADGLNAINPLAPVISMLLDEQTR
jgi:hypothetical protein